jgi:hypothetical protein
VKLGQHIQKGRHIAPAFGAAESDCDLLVFQEDFSLNRQ